MKPKTDEAKKIEMIGRVMDGDDGFGVRIKAGRDEFYFETSKYYKLLIPKEKWKITFEKIEGLGRRTERSECTSVQKR